MLGHPLPPAVVAGWRRHDGQRFSSDRGIAFGYRWLPVAEVARQWRDWADLRRDTSPESMLALRMPARSSPPRAIRREYTSPGWIPILQRPLEGNYVGIDLEPGPAGRIGQIINFGRDEDEKAVLAPDFETFLRWLVGELESGHVAVEHGRDEDGRRTVDIAHPRGDLIEVLRRRRLRTPMSRS